MRKLLLAATVAMAGLPQGHARAQAQTPAQAPAQEPGRVLTMAVGAPITSLDPHYHQLSPNNAVSDMIFDRLINTDARAGMVPGLALEWKAVAPTVWEFRLRPGVKFTNGSDFTAEDVAFTIARLPNVPNSPASYGVYAKPITRVEVVDPLTVRFHTAQPYPLLPLDMTNVRILDGGTHERATTEEFNATRAAIGTGPYRVTSYRNGDRIEFTRNDAYWGERPAFGRVTYRTITNDASRTAALLAGDVDVIDQVPTTDVAKLRGDARVTLSETVGLRLIYLALDHLRGPGENSPFVTDNDGKPLGRNPLRDARVRRALSMAIDRQAIADRIMEGAATPAGQFLPDGVTGHVPDVTPTRFDPEGARRLLAEAGYPQGFRIQLNGPNDRYINDGRIIQTVGQMWTRVGVRTAVEGQTWATFIGRAGRAEFSAQLNGWGSNPDGSHPLRNILATVNAEKGWGASNRGRYSNPEVDRRLEASLTEIDEAKRRTMVLDAQRIAYEDVGVIPIHIQTNVWALKRGLALEARNDELTRAQDVRPAQP